MGLFTYYIGQRRRWSENIVRQYHKPHSFFISWCCQIPQPSLVKSHCKNAFFSIVLKSNLEQGEYLWKKICFSTFLSGIIWNTHSYQENCWGKCGGICHFACIRFHILVCYPYWALGSQSYKIWCNFQSILIRLHCLVGGCWWVGHLHRAIGCRHWKVLLHWIEEANGVLEISSLKIFLKSSLKEQDIV